MALLALHWTKYISLLLYKFRFSILFFVSVSQPAACEFIRGLNLDAAKIPRLLRSLSLRQYVHFKMLALALSLYLFDSFDKVKNRQWKIDWLFEMCVHFMYGIRLSKCHAIRLCMCIFAFLTLQPGDETERHSVRYSLLEFKVISVVVVMVMMIWIGYSKEYTRMIVYKWYRSRQREGSKRVSWSIVSVKFLYSSYRMADVEECIAYFILICAHIQC